MSANLDTGGLLPLNEAAQQLGIEPKRLLGYLIRNRVGDPIGGETPAGIMVYEWSLESLKKRLAVTSNPAHFSGGQP